MRKVIVALACLLMYSMNGHAEQAVTGKKYLELCATSKEESNCEAVLISSIKHIEKTKIGGKKVICLPEFVGMPEEISVVKNFIRASPAYQHMSLDTLSLGALQAAFSCR